MYKMDAKVKKNKLDVEIDEFGELNSLNIEGDVVKFGFKKKLTPKAIKRLEYDKTGIDQLGTTYPSSYDREEQIKLSKKPNNLYRYSWLVMFATFFVIAIDFSCYWLLLGKKGKDYTTFLVAFGIAIAIDLLPVFFAHNLHRNECTRKKVLHWFNIVCIVFIGIFIFFVLWYRIYSGGNETSTNEINQTINKDFMKYILESIFYFLIPIATSLLCFIINYLNYNPIEAQLYKKKREILFKQEDINELKALITEIENKHDYEAYLLENDQIMFSGTEKMIDCIGEYYKSYVRTEIMKKLNSPAATTELTRI